jgi:4-hydroxy-tetrahydrodipicolinate synthase
MPIEGILPVIPTPFLGGRFDRESFGRLLDHMLPWLDGYTLLGSTGEAPSLPVAERMAIAEEALALTPGDKTVVVGVSHTSVSDAVELARHAEAHGAKGVLCSAPYYFQSGPGGIFRFLRELDAAVDIDVVLYDNPASTKTVLAADTVVAWSQELACLRSVKLTDHDLAKVAAWQEAGLRVLAGDDPILFRFLAAGVDGAMVIAPAVFPQAFRVSWDLVRAGSLGPAYEVFAREILPFLHVFGIGDEIATTKALLEEIGIFASGEVLPPLEPVGEERRALLRLAYDLARGSGAATASAELGPPL